MGHKLQNIMITILLVVIIQCIHSANGKYDSHVQNKAEDSFEKDDDNKLKKILSEEFYYKRIHTVKLEGSTGETVYWVNLYIGTPPQKQTAIIDMGNSYNVIGFPCSECKGENCGKHLNKYYNLQESSTSYIMSCQSTFENFKCQNCGEDNICQWRQDYLEGSTISGFMAVDYIVLGDEMQDYLDQKSQNQLSEEQENEYLTFINHERVQIPFGCTTTETHLFKYQVPDGIIGLGPTTNSASGTSPPNIIDRIFASHKENNEQFVFSLCLNSHKGGYMSVGGYNHELHIPGAETKIIDYNPDETQYELYLKEVRIGEKQVEVTTIVQTFLISGFTLIMGPNYFITSLIEEINFLCSTSYKCGNIKGEFTLKTRFLYEESNEFPTVEDFFNSFPTISFDFGGSDKVITIDLKPLAYLYIEDIKKSNLYSLAFEKSYSNKLYLGGPFFKNYDILFDKNQHKIHFTPSNCILPHINSVLMNLHSSKIRKTIKDSQFTEELKEFQKSFKHIPEVFDESKSKDNNEINNHYYNDITKEQDKDNGNQNKNENNKDNNKDQKKNNKKSGENSIVKDLINSVGKKSDYIQNEENNQDVQDIDKKK